MRILICAIFVLIAFSGCTRLNDLEDAKLPEWSPDVAFPLVNSKSSLEEVIAPFAPDANLVFDANGFGQLIYNDSVYTYDASEIATIPNLGFPFLLPSIDLKPLLPPDLQLLEADVKSGFLNYSFDNNESNDITVVIRLEDAYLGGVALEETIVVSYTGTVPNSVSGAIDLSNYHFDLSGSFVISYTAVNNVTSAPILPGNFTIAVQDVRFSYAEGYLGNTPLVLPPDVVQIDFFRNWSQGTIFFEEPTLTINVENSIGIPVAAQVNNLAANTQTSGLLPITSSLLTSPVTVAYPSLMEVGQRKMTSITFDKNNSSITSLVSAAPYEFIYDISASTNPANDPNIIGFVTDSSFLRADVDVVLPLYGWIQDYIVRDTFDLDLSAYEEFRYVNFKLITENGFPADVDMQLTFITDAGVKVDTLIPAGEDILEAASVDASGIVTSTTTVELITPFDELRFENLLTNASKIIVTAVLNSTDAPNSSVRLHKDNFIGVKLGVEAGLNTE